MTRGRRWTRVAHALVACIGLAILLYPLTLGTEPSVSCRGVQLRPGQSCAKADNSEVQTYEQRRRAALQARPVIAGVGVLVAVFGVVLLVGDLRGSRSAGRDVEGRSGIG